MLSFCTSFPRWLLFVSMTVNLESFSCAHEASLDTSFAVGAMDDGRNSGDRAKARLLSSK